MSGARVQKSGCSSTLAGNRERAGKREGGNRERVSDREGGNRERAREREEVAELGAAISDLLALRTAVTKSNQ